MNEITPDMQKNIDAYNKKHKKILASTAKALAGRGIVRVHYGLDYVNDDGEPADYAILEYADGRAEEQDAWFEELDINTFAMELRYCQPYTFEMSDAKIKIDLQGGMMEMHSDEQVMRAYHANTERQQWVAQEAENSKYQSFIIYNYEAIERTDKLLAKSKILEVHFGIDKIGDNYRLSEWGKLVKENKETWVEYFPKELQDLKLAIEEDFFNYGSFCYDPNQQNISPSPDGGLLVLENNEYAYNNQEHLAKLQKKFGLTT